MSRIPRNAKLLDVTFIIDSSVGNAGTHMMVEKTENGWKGTDDNGKHYHVFTEHLRNENFCKFKVVS